METKVLRKDEEWKGKSKEKKTDLKGMSVERKEFGKEKIWKGMSMERRQYGKERAWKGKNIEESSMVRKE